MSPSVFQVALPPESDVTRLYAEPDLADAFAIRLPDDASDDPEVLARFMFTHQAEWVGKLMALRDALVARVGITTTAQFQQTPESAPDERILFFRIYARHPREIVVGQNDSHLDFRTSLLLQMRDTPDGPARHLVMTTVVRCHNRLGRFYLAAIAPFHRMVVRSGLRQGARLGWPKANEQPTPNPSAPCCSAVD